MKKFIPFMGGLVVGSLGGGLLAGLVTFLIVSHEPTLTVRNITHHATTVLVETDTGETHMITELPPGESRSVKSNLRGHKAGLWLTATMPTGENIKSEEIYAPRDVSFYAIITEEKICLDYVF